MEFGKIFKALEDGVNFVERLTPLVSVLGGTPVGGVLKTAQSISEIIHATVNRAKEANVVFNENDSDKINALLNRLSAENDKLAETIRTS